MRACCAASRALGALVLDGFSWRVSAPGEAHGVLLGELGGPVERRGEPVQERRELALERGEFARVRGCAVDGICGAGEATPWR